jgi:hypothetical protein
MIAKTFMSFGGKEQIIVIFQNRFFYISHTTLQKINE